ncbi:MAG: thioredoxin [Spirochaetales bacterium]|nr:thioredoxin [Spirochaetales bacterium]
MLLTKLLHLETNEETENSLKENENAVICCGRMGPMCIPVYQILETLESDYSHVAFFDMDFDIEAAWAIRDLPVCATFMGLPFTVNYKHGKVVAAITSIQNKKQITEILANKFSQKESNR